MCSPITFMHMSYSYQYTRGRGRRGSGNRGGNRDEGNSRGRNSRGKEFRQNRYEWTIGGTHEADNKKSR